MKKKYLLIILFFGLSLNAFSQVITQEQVKNAVKEAKKELEEEEKLITASKPKPKVEKIKPDTIMDSQLFKFVNAKIIKAEVVNYYYTVSLYASPNTEFVNSLKSKVIILKKEMENNKKANIDTKDKEKEISQIDELTKKLESFNNTLDPNDPKKNFKIYYAPADPNFPVVISKIKFWPPTFSVITVPVKIRPRMKDIPSYSKVDIDNVGLFVSLAYVKERLFYNNEKSTHKIGGGIFLSPMVETLKPDNSPGLDVSETNQFFLSSGFAITYTYNKITFASIPAGFDIGFSDRAKKWRYEGKYWWGFGIGVDTSLFGF